MFSGYADVISSFRAGQVCYSDYTLYIPWKISREQAGGMSGRDEESRAFADVVSHLYLAVEAKPDKRMFVYVADGLHMRYQKPLIIASHECMLGFRGVLASKRKAIFIAVRARAAARAARARGCPPTLLHGRKPDEPRLGPLDLFLPEEALWILDGKIAPRDP